MEEAITVLGTALLAVVVLWTSLWVFYYIKGNAGVADLGWPVSIMMCTWIYVFMGSGDIIKALVLAAMITIWGIRLFKTIWKRFRIGREDPRYKDLRATWGGDPKKLLFLAMFYLQGIFTFAFALPAFAIGMWSDSDWHSVTFFGILLWMIGVVGEGFADRQLEAFKEDPLNRGKVCEEGLWRWSRHPNYFFECIVWLGVCLFVFPNPGGWLGIIPAALALYLLLGVSGIPLTEAHALQSMGDAYRSYQQRVSPFIPWFRK